MRRKLLGVAICVTAFGLMTAGGASAKGVLWINNHTGEHLANGTRVNIRFHASTTTTVAETTYTDECSASNAFATGTVAENGSKNVIVAEHTEYEGACSGGLDPAEESFTATIIYVRFTSSGKAQIQMAKNFAGPSTTALLLHVDHLGAHESCTYGAVRLTGTFATGGEALVIHGTVPAKLFKSVRNAPTCAGAVTVAFTAELFDTEDRPGNPLRPELAP